MPSPSIGRALHHLRLDEGGENGADWRRRQPCRKDTKNAIGVGELAIGRDIVDEAEFVAGLDQAAEGVLRALKATDLWRKTFGNPNTA